MPKVRVTNAEIIEPWHILGPDDDESSKWGTVLHLSDEFVERFQAAKREMEECWNLMHRAIYFEEYDGA